MHEQTVSIWNLATVPGHRKKGLASILSTTALLDAKKQGARYWYSFLASRGNAQGLMQRLGGQEPNPFFAYYSPPPQK